MLMGAMRLNIPTIFASGGPMRAGRPLKEGQPRTDLISIFEGVASNRIGKMSDEDLHTLECSACPDPAPAPACSPPTA
jgi:dihydroxy-acid dehydratase